MKYREIDWAAWVFMLIGAIDLGVVGVFKFDLIMTVFGTNPVLPRIMYDVIGVSGLYWLYRMITMKK